MADNVQASYSQTITRGIEGGLADLNPKRIVTGLVEETNGLSFGLGVIRGTAGDQVKLPSGSSDTLRGVSVHSHTVANDADDVAVFANTDAAPILREGEIYVKPEQATTRDAAAYCRYQEGAQVSTLTFDADIVTSNTVDMDVDGVALTQVTYATSHAATMAVIAAQLVTDFPLLIASAVVDGRTIEIISVGINNVVIDSIVVAAGASQAAGSWAVDRAYDSTLTVGRFRIDDGSISGIANTAVAFAATGCTYDEVCAAEGICKLNVNLT